MGENFAGEVQKWPPMGDPVKETAMLGPGGGGCKVMKGCPVLKRRPPALGKYFMG